MLDLERKLSTMGYFLNRGDFFPTKAAKTYKLLRRRDSDLDKTKRMKDLKKAALGL